MDFWFVFVDGGCLTCGFACGFALFSYIGYVLFGLLFVGVCMLLFVLTWVAWVCVDCLFCGFATCLTWRFCVVRRLRFRFMVLVSV